MAVIEAELAPGPIVRELGINQHAVQFLFQRFQQSHSDPLIALREFTQNAIDAGATDIRWTHHVTSQGVRKLCIVDNGDGFDPLTMGKLLGDLYASGRTQGVGKNHGIGAKTSGLAFSPFGVEYFTKNKGTASCYSARLLVSPDGRMGLAANDRGNTVTVVSRKDTPRDLLALESGTVVVFHGNDAAHDTTTNPGSAPGGRDWVSQYLNTRFYRWPEGTTVKVATPKSSSDLQLVTVTARGAADTLLRHDPTPTSGVASVRVAGVGTVNVHWWLDHELVKRMSSNGRERHGLQCSALYGSECYDLPVTPAAARARLALFGVRSVAGRVSLFVEMPADWMPNDARSHVAHKGGFTLPDWTAIGSAFAEAMPPAIERAEREASRRVRNESAGDYRDLLKAHLETFETWRLDNRGREVADCLDAGTADRPQRGLSTGSVEPSAVLPAPTPTLQRHGPATGSDRAHLTRPRSAVPYVRLVADSELDDPFNAAEWRREENVVCLNESSPVWQQLTGIARSLTVDGPAADELAAEAAMHAASLLLAGHVVNAHVADTQARQLPASVRAERYADATSASTLSTLLLPSPVLIGLVRDRLTGHKMLRRSA